MLSIRLAVVSLYLICVTASFLKQVEVEELPQDCKYVPFSSISGWWCCSSLSIPVEEFKGQKNMSRRSYPYIHPSCELFVSTGGIPELQLTSTMPSAWAAFVSSLIIFASVLSIVLVVVVCARKLGHLIARRRAAERSANAVRYSRRPLLVPSFSRTLSSIPERQEEPEVDLPNLVADVQAASERLSLRVNAARGNAAAGVDPGPVCSTFRPGAGAPLDFSGRERTLSDMTLAGLSDESLPYSAFK